MQHFSNYAMCKSNSKSTIGKWGAVHNIKKFIQPEMASIFLNPPTHPPLQSETPEFCCSDHLTPCLQAPCHNFCASAKKSTLFSLVGKTHCALIIWWYGGSPVPVILKRASWQSLCKQSCMLHSREPSDSKVCSHLEASLFFHSESALCPPPKQLTRQFYHVAWWCTCSGMLILGFVAALLSWFHVYPMTVFLL